MFFDSKAYRQIIFSLLIFIPSVSFSQTINLTFDYSNANATLDILKKRITGESDIDRLINWPITQNLIQKISSYDKTATKESFRSTLINSIKNKENKPDPFGWQKAMGSLAASDSMLSYIVKNESKVKGDIIKALQSVSPADLKTDITVHFIIGGTSDGFSPNNKEFFIALQYFDSDITGMTKMMTHELYHCIQAEYASGYSSFAKKLEKNELEFFLLLLSTYKEGSAVFAGGSFLGIPTGKYSDWYGQKFQRNLDSEADNYLLFDLIGFRLLQDSGSNFSDFQKFGFSGKWDSRFYFLGYRMAEIIAKSKGKEFLVQSLTNPMKFYFAYVNIYRSDDSIKLRFTPAIEKMILALYEKSIRD